LKQQQENSNLVQKFDDSFPCAVCLVDGEDATNEGTDEHLTVNDNQADAGVKLPTTSAASVPLDFVEPPEAVDTIHQLDDVDGDGSDEVMGDDGAAAASESTQTDTAAGNSRSNSTGFVFSYFKISQQTK